MRIARFKTDGEYEEHYRMAFGQAVKRRLRADSPVLARAPLILQESLLFPYTEGLAF